MKNDNIIQSKSFQFAVRIIHLYKALVDQKKEFVLARQILKSGTSIGANVEEAIGAQSKKDFIAKMSIAYKETRETGYWLKLLQETKFINLPTAASFLKDCDEIAGIIATILKTAKKNLSLHS